MVYCVFPKVEGNEWYGRCMPQEFATYAEAEEYKEELEASGIEADIEEGSGELV